MARSKRPANAVKYDDRPFGRYGLCPYPRTGRFGDHGRYSESLAFGLAILECFNGGPQLGIFEIADKLYAGRSTVHRYALTFVMLGWLEQGLGRKYRLAPGVSPPGRTVLNQIVDSIGGETVLAQLRDWTGHTVSVGVLDGNRVTLVRRWHAHGVGQYEADLDLRGGAHVPLHCTALGKALLASLDPKSQERLLDEIVLTRHTSRTVDSRQALSEELKEIAEADGAAFADQELAEELRSVAMALAIPVGPLRLAVGVDVPIGAKTVHTVRHEIAPLVRKAVVSIENGLKAA